MDSKVLKQNLKEAKDAIKNKKYADALKICKLILREDRTNYMALVLHGAAMQETELRAQAPNSYRLAIQANPDQTLAWQGLVSFYENNETDEGKEELIDAYQKLVKLESNAGRKKEITNKLAQLAQRLGKVDVCVDALRSQQEALQGDLEGLTDTWRRIASVLSTQQTLSDQQSIQLEESLSHIIDNTTSVENMENLRRYLHTLYRLGKLALLAEWSVKAGVLFRRAEFPLEWACRAYSEAALSSPQPFLNALMPQACEDLLSLNEHSGLGLLAQGNFFYTSGKVVEARDVLVQASQLLPQSAWVWELLSRCHIRLHNADDAELTASLGAKVLSGGAQMTRLEAPLSHNLLMALAMSEHNDKLLQAISQCHQLLQQNPGNLLALQCLAGSSLALGRVKEARNAMGMLKKLGGKEATVTALECRLLLLEDKQDEASQIFSSKLDTIDAAADAGNVAKAWFELGELQWKKGQYNDALPLFFKAAKVDPLFCRSFSRLADFYRVHGNDQDKARRCYQKACRLNPRCQEAGIGLSDVYRAQNNHEANLELLTNASGAGCQWAWLRLGLLHLQMGNTEEAINQLLAALRTQPDNSLCWESLGDAYMVRGAYTAAVKSFQKVLELNPHALYPAIQVANIKLLLGELSEAEQDFLSVLADNSDYVPALKGLGETHLSQARDFLGRQLNGLARDKCEDALTILTKAAKTQGNLSCVWKLMGDACLLPAKLEKDIHMLVCTSLLGQKNVTGSVVRINQKQLVQLATRCYCRALSLGRENSVAWHDLALSYQAQARLSAPEECKDILEKALSAARQATQLAPTNTHHWNVLGVIAASPGLKQFTLAQHSLIRAVQLQSGNVQAWTNLGTLYLSLGDASLAHQAFAAAQRTEPSYVQCWLGQALIAEGMGHSDAMDLFRHSTQLATHAEGSLGYAHWVCSSLNNQPDSPSLRQAIAAAADELTWYTGRVASNSCAYNLLGLLLERQGLRRGAAAMLGRALEVAGSEDVASQDKARTNLARVLSTLGNHLEAVEHLKKLSQPSFHSQCILANAYFKAEMYQESYTAYESAWHWLAQDDAQKSHILVAMAAMAYKFQGPDGAKSQLFKCAQLKPPSVQGLFASCALGMLHSDLQLSRLVLKELQPYRDNPEHMADVALFQAYTHFLQSQWTESIRGLSKMVHRHPDHAPLWLALALLLLNMHPHAPASASAPCAGAALALGRASMDISKVQSLVSLSHLQAGHAHASLLEAQRAVHLFPDRPESWAVLVAAELPRCVARRSASEAAWLRATVGLVRRHQECPSRALAQWLSNHERKAALLCEELKA